MDKAQNLSYARQIDSARGEVGMEKYQWVIHERLGSEQREISLRTLMQKQWLLPKRFVHYLRIRRQVLINDKYEPMDTIVKSGDKITLNFIGDEFRNPTSNRYVPTPHPSLKVLFENRDLLVVDKPRGQKSHPNMAGESGTLMNDAAGYLGGQAYMVHRLDQETSGTMIVAKNPVVVPILDRLMSAGLLHREYLALVEGQLSGRGEWNWPIGDSKVPWQRQVNGRNAQNAQTFYQVLKSTSEYSLVKLTLGTGRTHQLRVHLAYADHPIVGDPIYNPNSLEKMHLHAIRQQIILPFTNKKQVIIAQPPHYFEEDLLKYKLE